MAAGAINRSGCRYLVCNGGEDGSTSAVTYRRAAGEAAGSLWERRNVAYFVFLSPWLIGFVLWTGGPLLASLFLGFTQYDVSHHHGGSVCKTIYSLFSDDLFWQALKVTSIYTFLGVPLMMITSLGLTVLPEPKGARSERISHGLLSADCHDRRGGCPAVGMAAAARFRA